MTLGGSHCSPTPRRLGLHLVSWGALRPGTVLLGTGLSLVSQEKLTGAPGCHCHPSVPGHVPPRVGGIHGGPPAGNPEAGSPGCSRLCQGAGRRQQHHLALTRWQSNGATGRGESGREAGQARPLTGSEGLSASRPRHTCCPTWKPAAQGAWAIRKDGEEGSMPGAQVQPTALGVGEEAASRGRPQAGQVPGKRAWV